MNTERGMNHRGRVERNGGTPTLGKKGKNTLYGKKTKEATREFTGHNQVVGTRGVGVTILVEKKAEGSY